MRSYYCFVPGCSSNNSSTPGKFFFYLPKGEKRKEWLSAARSNTEASLTSTRRCCEDHFNIEEDVENLMEFKLKKQAGQPCKLRLKKGVKPHIFDCQPFREPNRDVAQEERSQDIEDLPEAGPSFEIADNMVETDAVTGETLFESSQAFDSTSGVSASNVEQLSQQIESLCILETQVDDQAAETSLPIIVQVTEIPVSAGQVKGKSQPSKPGLAPRKRRRVEDNTEGDYVYFQSSSSTSSHSQSKPAEEERCTPMQDYELKHLMSQSREVNMKIMELNTRLYLGVPDEAKELINFLQKYTGLDRLDIFLALRRIRLGETLDILGHVFGLDKGTVSKKINFAVPLLAQYFKEFIFWASEEITQSHVPIPFRSRHSRVSCIIDCLEISIQKPSNPVRQSETYSAYKHTNTAKYLIACSPHGFTSFISKGFGGRTSDNMIVKKSGFLDVLPNNTLVMSDRGFKHVKALLKKKGCRLVRPPSVEGNEPLTKAQVRDAKIIASQRVHVERVIRRLREFTFLRPHSCVHHESLRILDSCVTIACGLINFQSSIVKCSD